MSSSFDSDTEKSPETLEQEIDAKRASINNIVDSLESRFTPGQLFDQALQYTKGNGGEFFQNLGTTVKNNPVPTLLTGVGLAWLALNQNRPFNPGTPRTGRDLGEKLADMAGSVTDSVSGVLSRARTQLHDSTDNAAGTVHSLKDKAGDYVDQASHGLDSASGHLQAAASQVQANVGKLKGQFDQQLQQQPLVVAAVGIALGAILGAAVPLTRKEEQLLGDTSDKLKAKGQEIYDKVKEGVESDDAGPAGEAKSAPPATDLSAGLGVGP